MALYHFSNLSENQINRLATGIDELDWMYGYTEKEDFVEYGMPIGASSLWGGSAGIGKTRAVVTVSKELLKQNKTVLFFTLEMSPELFKNKYCKGINKSSKLYLSDTAELDGQIELIHQVNPDLVIVDSVTKIKEYAKGQGANKIEVEYRKAIKNRCHVIFIAQLNITGHVKGGTDLPHMTDIVFKLKPFDPNIPTSCFIITCDDKNRYGKTGVSSAWGHKDWGAECQSNHRLNDIEWIKHHQSTKVVKDKLLENHDLPVEKPKTFLDFVKSMF